MFTLDFSFQTFKKILQLFTRLNLSDDYQHIDFFHLVLILIHTFMCLSTACSENVPSIYYFLIYLYVLIMWYVSFYLIHSFVCKSFSNTFNSYGEVVKQTDDVDFMLNNTIAWTLNEIIVLDLK